MDKIEIDLIPAAEEPHYKEPERQKDIVAFHDEARRNGVELQPMILMQKDVLGGSWLSGMFLLELIKVATPIVAPLGTGLIGYLAAKKGRKVRVKVGNTEIEAGSPEEVATLLQILKDHSNKS